MDFLKAILGRIREQAMAHGLPDTMRVSGIYLKNTFYLNRSSKNWKENVCVTVLISGERHRCEAQVRRGCHGELERERKRERER